MQYNSTREFAEKMDLDDPLKGFREKFHIPKTKEGKDVIYFAGNSLGLQPKTVRSYVEQELADWESMGVEGHIHAKHPWLPYHEFLTENTAMLVGALPEEVVNMNSLTVNLHLMLVSFYRPNKSRFKIMIESNAFPSDHYAVQSHLRYHGFDPAEGLIEMKPRDGEDTIRTEDILAKIEDEGDSIALVMFAGVNYYTGQAFDIGRITEAAHAKGITAGFDLAHAAGNLKLELNKWDVDFAVWCSYKYLNAGPGAIAGAYVNRRHLLDMSIPKFWGWWGQDKATRFLMHHDFQPIPTVESWQLSNPPILQLAALRASLDAFAEAKIENLRAKSELMTGYLEFLLKKNNNISIITPEDPAGRGCQLSLRAAKEGKKLHTRLNEAGVICDWREPDVIRIAPVPLYNTFTDVWQFVDMM